MKAFVVKFEQLFRMDTGVQGGLVNFCENKRKLLIPLYQREYTWPDEKIITLVNDIKRCNKYLGNIILDEKEACYEIVDGQQRITTCFLILACLYNNYNGHQREQDSLLRLIKPYGEFCLKNDSVGDYICEQNGVMSLTIKSENDVYFQVNDFKRAFSTISKEIEKIKNQGLIVDFKQKLLDCEILVLINDRHDNMHPVEQLFLDINEKAQELEPEDIFKGHCFENYEEYLHEELRTLWIQFKKCAMGFKQFGLKDASNYIYMYLLETEDDSIPENLTEDGKHYLDGKNMDATESILKEMITYGQANLNFYEKLSHTDYRFADLCQDSYQFRNTEDHLILKQMCKEMLENTTAKYQKLPFLYFIYSLRKNKEIVNIIKHVELRKIITNLYIYMMLFIISGARKSKKDIDYTIRDALKGENGINQIIIAARELRNKKVGEFTLPDNANFDKLSFIYSITDQYVSNSNWVRKIYSNETGYTLEHFIIPDNRNRKIYWKDGKNMFEFDLPVEDVRLYKKKAVNYLVIDKNLNESLEHDDIVSKINAIRLWFERRNQSLPKHIAEIVKHIEQIPEYMELKGIRGGNYTQENIKVKYIAFVRAYFDSANNIQKRIQEIFKHSFQND